MSEKIKQISVLMPTYNCGKYIRAAISSILAQTFTDFEFIIVDDGSTDNTEEIVSSFKDSRIIYIKTENKGTSAALNYGLTIAKNEWVARIDADDINVKTRLEMQVKFIEEYPEFDIISSWSVYFRDPRKILFRLSEPVRNEHIQEYLDLHNPMNQSALIYRKSVIIDAGYNESFHSNEDFELFYRIRDKVKFYNIPEFLVYTRVRNDSRTFTESRSNMFELLFNPAFRNMMDAKSKGDHFYWAGNIAWINFFFGKKEDSRSYLKSSVSFKNFIAYVTTFLPHKYFNKLIDSHIKYRFINLFLDNSRYRKELKTLLNAG